jgi:hypothetical protein
VLGGRSFSPNSLKLSGESLFNLLTILCLTCAAAVPNCMLCLFHFFSYVNLEFSKAEVCMHVYMCVYMYQAQSPFLLSWPGPTPPLAQLEHSTCSRIAAAALDTPRCTHERPQHAPVRLLLLGPARQSLEDGKPDADAIAPTSRALHEPGEAALFPTRVHETLTAAAALACSCTCSSPRARSSASRGEKERRGR